jgi:hypothetical protein
MALYDNKAIYRLLWKVTHPNNTQDKRVYLTSSDGKPSRLESYNNSRVKGVVGRRLDLTRHNEIAAAGRGLHCIAVEL